MELAGAGGFEPPHDGIKIRCLTTWLRPNSLFASNIAEADGAHHSQSLVSRQWRPCAPPATKSSALLSPEVASKSTPDVVLDHFTVTALAAL